MVTRSKARTSRASSARPSAITYAPGTSPGPSRSQWGGGADVLVGRRPRDPNFNVRRRRRRQLCRRGTDNRELRDNQRAAARYDGTRHDEGQRRPDDPGGNRGEAQKPTWSAAAATTRVSLSYSPAPRTFHLSAKALLRHQRPTDAAGCTFGTDDESGRAPTAGPLDSGPDRRDRR